MVRVLQSCCQLGREGVVVCLVRLLPLFNSYGCCDLIDGVSQVAPLAVQVPLVAAQSPPEVSAYAGNGKSGILVGVGCKWLLYSLSIR